MSESQSERFTVVNMRDQPVELYIGAESVTLPAYGEIEVTSGDLAAPHVAAMRQRQAIDVRPATLAAASDEQDQADEPTATAAAEEPATAEESTAEEAESAAAEEPAPKEQPARRTRRKS